MDRPLRARMGLATLLAVAACTTGEPSPLALRFSFANPETASRTDHVSVSIVRGDSCSGDELVYRADVSRSGDVTAPPTLEAGSYAFVGKASSSECDALAYGCVTVRLPRSSAPEVVLQDVTPRPFCEGSCESACTPDAGTPTRDAGPTPAPDAGQDGSPDEPDAGPPPPDAGMGEPDAGPPPPCDDGVLAPSRHCYRFVRTPTLPWEDAETDCVGWGGHLVSLGDADEELWLYGQTLAQFGGVTRFWIGFTDAANETVWEWTDGSSAGKDPSLVVYDLDDPQSLRFKVPFDEQYTHWGPNLPAAGNDEPNNGNASNPDGQEPGEDCADSSAEIDSPGGVTPRPAWDDQNCANAKPYVCER